MATLERRGTGAVWEEGYVRDSRSIFTFVIRLSPPRCSRASLCQHDTLLITGTFIATATTVFSDEN